MYPDTITEELQKLAGEAYDSFQQIERGDETITVKKPGAPAWVDDLVREAHGDMFPDDWRYDTIQSACGAIHDASEGADITEVGAEFADSTVDVYTTARYEWLASNLHRQSYVDDAAAEFGPSEDICQAVGMGQYQEANEIFYSVAGSLGDRLEDVQDECENCGETGLDFPTVPVDEAASERLGLSPDPDGYTLCPDCKTDAETDED